MSNVASRELRNQTRSVLDRVRGGESITITIDGQPVATMEPIQRRPQWMSKTEFVRRVLANQADPALAEDLRRLAPDTTDDLALP